jgi:hypothetical protein
VHQQPGEQDSGTFVFAILHREKTNKVFRKRSSRDYSESSSRLVYHRGQEALRLGIVFIVSFFEVFRRR